MDKKITGQALMLIGVVCGLFYTLAAMYQDGSIFSPLSTALLYVGIATIITGLVLYGLAGAGRESSRRTY